MVESTRLLILSCTRRKRLDDGPLPAIERYDGPTFRVLRRYLGAAPANPPVTYILSAECGLIDVEQPIAHYDRTMTSKRADELRPAVVQGLTEAIFRTRPISTLVLVGQRYADALDSTIRSPVHVVTGSLGRQLALLHDWLYGAPPAGTPTRFPSEGVPQCWRGIPLPADREAMLAAAAAALERCAGVLPPVNSWYVGIDHRQIPLKWLFSQLTGLPVGAFHSGDARRMLNRLGVEVGRV